MGMSSGGGSGVSSVTADINVTPMADIMLVLLIIFMITTPLLQEGVYLNMAKAQNAQVAEGATDEDSTTIAVTRDEKIYLNKQEVSLAMLPQKLQESVLKNPDKPLFFKSLIPRSPPSTPQALRRPSQNHFLMTNNRTGYSVIQPFYRIVSPSIPGFLFLNAPTRHYWLQAGLFV
jgi:biopolymer transport protein ExbD